MPTAFTPATSGILLNLGAIGLLYMAYPDGGQQICTFLTRLRPYPMRGHLEIAL